MFKWITALKDANPKTRYFAFNWAIYGIAIIVTTLYCYARLDYVRSGKTQKAHEDTRNP